jgi:hypothetical protein
VSKWCRWWEVIEEGVPTYNAIEVSGTGIFMPGIKMFGCQCSRRKGFESRAGTGPKGRKTEDTFVCGIVGSWDRGIK